MANLRTVKLIKIKKKTKKKLDSKKKIIKIILTKLCQF